MHWQVALGAQIKSARVGAGLTQEQLAQNLSVSREQLSNIENGKSAAAVNIVGEIAAVLKTEFAVEKCKIIYAAQVDIPSTEQLCFPFDVEQTFKNAELTITPKKHAIHVTAIIPLRTQSA